MYRTRDVMNTHLVVLRDDATAEDAIAALVRKGISGAPVVNRSGELVGLISEYRLLEAIYEPGFKACPIREIMTPDPITISENAYLSDAAGLMLEHRIRRLPVVRQGALVGIIARRDLLRYVIESGETLDEFLGEVTAMA